MGQGRAVLGARSALLLREDNWNDWFKYRTLYSGIFVDSQGVEHELGLLKIGQVGMTPPPEESGPIRPPLPPTSDGFDHTVFSLGQDESYYERVSALGPSTRDAIHRALRDIAFDESLLDEFLDEDVMGNSLLRDVPIKRVRGQFHRMAHGGVRLTPYNFSFVSPNREGVGEDFVLTFEVRPDSLPPTNIHAIIGRNGVGKSTLLNRMANSLLGHDHPTMGRFLTPNGNAFRDFNNLVSVSFSAFDDFQAAEHDDSRAFGYSYIGLKKTPAERGPESPRLTLLEHQLELLGEAVGKCLFFSRRERWQRALRTLASDPIFEQTQLAELLECDESPESIWNSISSIFQGLSSGHKIVLVSITRLVASVEEKTLVLIDEPEAHLHPPLLSAYVRALSELLVNRNGVAIVATHSPVVLQETPRTCVWKLSRVGATSVAQRPQIETFAENVGTLTNEVFGLEVTATGFHKMLTDASIGERDYGDALALFSGQVGLEGKSILLASILNQSQEKS